jgi:hypothetical protein
MNARGVNWDLCLNKPYLNNGYENSSRVFGSKGFDMCTPGQAGACRSAAKLYPDSINNPAVRNKFWTAEVALPMWGLLLNQTRARAAAGALWRINFSRVEWRVVVAGGHYEKAPSVPEDNWVWAPMGVVDVHLPERWGYLQLAAGRINGTLPVRDPEWRVRTIATQLYYAQTAYAGAHNGAFSGDLEVLALLAPMGPAVVNGTCSATPHIRLSPSGFDVEVSDGRFVARIDETRFLLVVPAGGDDAHVEPTGSISA